jgi:hypothetical protein
LFVHLSPGFTQVGPDREPVTLRQKSRRVARRAADLWHGLVPGIGAGTTGVFVLGMHRSGTSAFARIVNLIGVPLGSDNDEFSPGPANPRGYWESRRLSLFQDTLLDRLGGSWDAPPRLEDGWERSLSMLEPIGRGRRIFGIVYPNAHLWAWKDPRTAITLPFWLRALRARPVIVVIHRHPLEVAHSLAIRSTMPKLEALALWERYNRAILRNAVDLPAFVTSFPRIIGDPASEAVRMVEFLSAVDVELPTEVPHEALHSFVEPSLRHSVYEDADLTSDDDVTPEQRALRAALISLEGAHETLPTMHLPPESPAVESLLDRRRAPQHQRKDRLQA